MGKTNRLPFESSPFPGFRLEKLEILNWGTFDRQIYCMSPSGKSALLIGQNGTGKSTIVDALLTLLVRPGVRNFNVAAGAKKRERSEKSYLLGAYDRGSDDDGQNIRVKHLRPDGKQYSVILARFHNHDIAQTFSVAQVLYLTSDHSVEKVYSFATRGLSIQDDFCDLESTDLILKTLRNRSIKATKTFQEYEGWFSKVTHIKSKAMAVFNQTVAVKDIEKLNVFIRDHMLEAHDWSEKVDRLLGHFTQLSEAHESLVRVRQQRNLLEPVARIGEEYQEHAAALKRAQRLRDASNSYFFQKTIDLFVPAIEQRELEKLRVRKNREVMALLLKELQENCRSLQNQIDQAGGDRLQEITRLIELEQLQATHKRQRSCEFDDALQLIEIDTTIDNEDSFTELQSQLPNRKLELKAESESVRQQQEASILERGQLRRELTELRDELVGLMQRRENIPEWCVQLRKTLCEELGLALRDLPFAAELIQVHPAEREWEASIEKVLHGLALSLLVPDKFYSSIAAHVERTRLFTDGRGRKLVYLRVAEQLQQDHRSSPARDSVIHKLMFRDGHTLLPWLKAELNDRYDYTCCDTIEEFRNCHSLAMTRNRHVKSGRKRHEKDDRDHVVDPRNFVLGWDNKEKKHRIHAEIQRREQLELALSKQIESFDRQQSQLQTRLTAVDRIQSIASFSEVDFAIHENEIRILEQERLTIESQSDVLRTLKQRLTETQTRCSQLEQKRDELIGDERELENQITVARKLITNAKHNLHERQAAGTLEIEKSAFAELDQEFVTQPLSTETLFDQKQFWQENLDRNLSQLRARMDPIRNRLTEAMSKFLRVCPEESAELMAATNDLDSFLKLRQRILEDDLPRHENRFKERLNQKVIEEIGLFRSALEQERRAIEDKIELLNQSLKKLEYRPNMHIQLRPRTVRNAEIQSFQTRLRECVEGSFEDTAEANEARFLRIKELIVRLRDDDSRKWRDKVTDVRQWFDFVAEVIDRETLEPVSFYEDSSGQSGGEKAKLAFTILVAAIAYQYDLDPEHQVSDRFHFVVVDEMFSKVDDQHAEYALDLFRQFGLQLLIVAPLDAKAKVTQPYVGCYLHVVKKENRSAIYEMTATEFDEFAASEDAHISANGRAF